MFWYFLLLTLHYKAFSLHSVIFIFLIHGLTLENFSQIHFSRMISYIGTGGELITLWQV